MSDPTASAPVPTASGPVPPASVSASEVPNPAFGVPAPEPIRDIPAGESTLAGTVNTVPLDPRRPHVDPARPFGAHVRTRWWAPLVVIPVVLIGMLILQVISTFVTIPYELFIGGHSTEEFTNADAPTLTPVMMLGVNLSLIATGLLALLALRVIAGVPWRAAFAVGRRFSWGRLLRTAGVMAPVILVFFALMELLFPSVPMTGEAGFGITATGLALLAITVLTTPLQAAAEEVVFRGVIGEMVASWIRPASLALVVGIIASSLIFGASHGSVDPWLFAYYTIFGLSGALMARITDGLEASIAFHASNNTLLFIATALTIGDQGLTIDRSAGSGGPFMLVFIALDLLLVAIVWLLEKRRRARSAATDPARAVLDVPTTA